MNEPRRPAVRPANPRFSSGPCAKRPGWTPDALAGACLGRSHRAGPAEVKLAQVIARSRRLLGLPPGYRLALLPGSDTGAVEAALWSLLGPRGVDVLAWDAFGRAWVTDVVEELALADVRVLTAPYGEIADLDAVDFGRDVVFTWNGTSSGVCVPGGGWIADDRAGLTIADATSAAFAMEIPWEKVDVATYSWQKVLGGEAQHGMLILGPRAVERLESHTPAWPVPKLFRLSRAGRVDETLFRGETINTPSMMAVEDVLDALDWAEGIGGREALIARTRDNYAAIEAWVRRTPWVEFLARNARVRSPTSVCLDPVEPWFTRLEEAERRAAANRMAQLLEDEGAAYDIGGYRTAPPGLRIWAGATVERGDLEALFPWLDWAHAVVAGEYAARAG